MMLDDYTHFTSSGASPDSYHVWIFLSMISSILGKKAFIRCNYFNVFANQYIILASMPGIGKKSTAMRTGRQVIQDAELAVKYSNDSMTAQALMNELVDSFSVITTPKGTNFGSSALTVIASELVSLLFTGPPMVDFLTDIYDSDSKFEYKTKNAGVTTIDNPCLNILAGVTTDSLNARVIQDATSGGFMSRSIIVYDNRTKPSGAFSMPSDDQLESRQRVVDSIGHVADIYGEFCFTKDALKLYEAYEVKEDKSLKSNPVNVEFRSRKPIHVLKACMALAASEFRTKINSTDMEYACGLLDEVERNMVFVHIASGTHKNAEVHNRIVIALGIAQEIDYYQLLSHFMSSMDEESFENAVQTMANVGWITRKVDTSCKPAQHKLALTKKGREMFYKYK